ncbi:transcriptional regulator, AraC family [Lishizhenia tianjinensis]|uniref:Transcriptional regulator, AraC family n=1 Tax=Lishizhenia tianjinensis TaxID=477690 RepID=A0A1I6X8C2_9FLAO|nr:helix-turn-helix domain-containing protein [Lishizhenia tianjinensis]SFT34539.1 transcriptional regulator, AraC family [Lishizhenia tianjinensis]
MKQFITPYQLTEIDKLNSLVEHRSKFSANFCELNLFETREKAKNFNLKFNGLTITSMLRGKKVMHMSKDHHFDYLPGETVIIPSDTLIQIDFPEAKMDNPTQCTALAIDNSYISRQLELINDNIKPDLAAEEWNFNFNEVLLKNNEELAQLSNKLLQVFTGNDPFRDYNVDFVVRELLLNVIRVQNLHHYKNSFANLNSPVYMVIQFIMAKVNQNITIDDLCKVACMSKSNLYRIFVEEVGIPPGQLILDEKINYAKKLLTNKEISVKEVAYASGFNDPNYFCRAFKKYEGLSPNQYRKKH